MASSLTKSFGTHRYFSYPISTDYQLFFIFFNSMFLNLGELKCSPFKILSKIELLVMNFVQVKYFFGSENITTKNEARINSSHDRPQILPVFCPTSMSSPFRVPQLLIFFPDFPGSNNGKANEDYSRKIETRFI